MSKPRKKYTPEEKAKIALEALSGHQTQSQLTSKYGVHSTQINAWKKQLKTEVADIFRDRRKRDEYDKEQLIEQLYQKVGQLNMEIDWLKKKSELFD
jgi:transposase-like protein